MALKIRGYSLTNTELDDMIAKSDGNGDANINYLEFVDIVKGIYELM